MKGLIFDIQRGSFVDGDGVRTTVFFKGCSLRCKWCHNPEGIGKGRQMLYYKSKCYGCQKCVQVCENQGKECTLCGKCTAFCPADARQICGEEYSHEELLSIILRDRELYSQTGGGVTFSGGECVLQIDFLEEMLKACKKEGINTAVDTAGNVPTEYIRRILPYVDTFLYDIKCVDSELHRQFTGYSNSLILENLDYLCQSGACVVVRVPVVVGFNANDGEMNRIFELLKGKNVHRVELMPYHRLGEHKYEGVGLTPWVFQTPSQSQMKKYNKMLGEKL